MNKFVVAIILLIIAMVIVMLLLPPNIIDDKDTNESLWYEPTLTETGVIGRTLSKNGINGCGEFQIKVITTSEYLVACTSDGRKWIYYMVNTNAGKVLIANDEMKNKLIPPQTN